MNNIDLELYRIFKIVADNNNITKASELLFISQPAVTKQINNLEDRLNKKLFDRTKNGTFLTVFALYPSCFTTLKRITPYE